MLYHFSEPRCVHLRTGVPVTSLVLSKSKSSALPFRYVAQNICGASAPESRSVPFPGLGAISPAQPAID